MFRLSIFIYLSPLLVIVCCHRNSHDNKFDAIFGKDGRAQIPESYTYIGNYGNICTAFAVAPRLIMTAAHCTFGEQEHKWTTHGSNQTYSSTLLQRGMASPKGRSKIFFAEVMNDWAILKLDRPVERWIEIDTAAKQGDKVAVIGYSEDLSGATGHNGCTIKSIKFNAIGHDCDMRAGASGGPVLKRINDKWFFVGIQSTENCDGNDCIHEEWTERNSNHAALMTDEIANAIKSYNEIFPN